MTRDVIPAHRQRLCKMLLDSVLDLKQVDKADAATLLIAVCQRGAVDNVDKLHSSVAGAIACHAMFLENLRDAASDDHFSS